MDAKKKLAHEVYTEDEQDRVIEMLISEGYVERIIDEDGTEGFKQLKEPDISPNSKLARWYFHNARKRHD